MAVRKWRGALHGRTMDRPQASGGVCRRARLFVSQGPEQDAQIPWLHELGPDHSAVSKANLDFHHSVAVLSGDRTKGGASFVEHSDLVVGAEPVNA